jgi:hypothetical protein
MVRPHKRWQALEGLRRTLDADTELGEMRRAVLREGLHDLLVAVNAAAGPSFSGTGVLISSDPSSLPITSLRPVECADPGISTLDALIAMSDLASEFHDGFHVLSPDLQLVRISQYFSPPILSTIARDPGRRLGGRYMAALFGSALPGVLVSGVVSPKYGVAVFERGREIRQES